MNNISVIENRISSVRKYLRILENYKKSSRRQLEDDVTIGGAALHYFYLVCQSTIDLAEAIVAFKNFRKPTTFRENFQILGEEGVIPLDLVKKLEGLVGFRNVIAHGYENIDYDKVYNNLQGCPGFISDFLKKAADSLRINL